MRKRAALAALVCLATGSNGCGYALLQTAHTEPPGEIAACAEQLGLDVVQLHGDPGARTIGEVRRRVTERTGIALVPEVRIVGEAA